LRLFQVAAIDSLELLAVMVVELVDTVWFQMVDIVVVLVMVMAEVRTKMLVEMMDMVLSVVMRW
jgi:hypothetical protein